jgi:hypothetical protein
MLTQRLKQHGADAGFDALLRERLAELPRLADEFTAYAASTDLNHRIYTLLDPDRLLALHGDLQRQVAN